ncbi:hypothetical protein ACO22_00075 [Paracoccidioides brasiliensis]|uniref:Uncharacterized protein n=1 Tax=Paracoccidioides brasiliensis TaxID=121759 RepID=A0A1D2JQF0_PARBR|nr:hypothetical protein ACO22_00075 [Paracoccidioides brasiliensis]
MSADFRISLLHAEVEGTDEGDPERLEWRVFLHGNEVGTFNCADVSAGASHSTTSLRDLSSSQTKTQHFRGNRWKRLIQNTIVKYEILKDDIYNFDETGFQMSVIETARVMTESERAENPKLVQSEDQK